MRELLQRYEKEYIDRDSDQKLKVTFDRVWELWLVVYSNKFYIALKNYLIYDEKSIEVQLLYNLSMTTALN